MTEIIHSRIGVLTYLAPTGPLIEKEGLAQLQKTTEECREARETDIILDLSKVPLLNGAALDVLLDIQASLTRYGGSLRTINANALIKDIFRISGFNDYVDTIDET